MFWSGKNDFNQKMAVLLIGIGSAAIVVAVYHIIYMSWCRRRHQSMTRRVPSQQYVTSFNAPMSSIEHSVAQLIPVHKYDKSRNLMGDDEATCAICLTEFEEGEELRTLPECLHSYHAECIGMWFCSHSSCPVCRTDALPSPQVVLVGRDMSMERSESNNVILQSIVVNPGSTL